jgi:selenocysteine lyase/cysteine desulfurase
VYKDLYKLFLAANPGVQHYAAHSHHYWPDVTRDAVLEYWADSAKYVDDKWDYIFSAKVPEAQRLIAEVLNLSNPEQIVFAPNTHEFILRLFSCFDPRKKLRVLTTDSEFHSFSRETRRMEESELLEVDRVPTDHFSDFEVRFKEKLKSGSYDLVFLSQVFFNSGHAVTDLKGLIEAADADTMFIVDGYHAFMAVPTDLSEIQNRIFYIAGSYKYAQGGEGCCFMSVPKNSAHRPLNTGWFAGFSDLSKSNSMVNYSSDGYRFAGSTMDFTALYRLISVLELFKSKGISVNDIHQHIMKLQTNFREHLQSHQFEYLSEKNILRNDYHHHGHFYAFELNDAAIVKNIHDELRKNKIVTDYRGTRLRFGFGLYQEDCINLNGIKSI